MTEPDTTVGVRENLEITRGRWQVIGAVILVVAAILRLYDLNLVPLHHDEGVNGSFLLKLVHDGIYKYDPQNYHGPTLYYFAVVIPWILRLLFSISFADTYGLSVFSIRFVTAAFGVATVWLVLTLRRRIGRNSALAAAGLLAVSPGAVYLSRYFIHETLFVFFTLAAVAAAIRFYESARPMYLMLAAAATALLFATKETAMISVGVLLIALASTAMFIKLREVLRNRSNASRSNAKDEPMPEVVAASSARFDGPSSLIIPAIAAVSLFLTIEILFYSSFFTNYPQGIYDALKTFRIWAQTGKTVHVHPWSTYLSWMGQEESPLLLLGLAGLGLALWRGANRFAIFAGLWAFGLIVAYSLIPYKTPWLMANFVVPLALISGYALGEIHERRKRPTVALAIAAAALGVSGYQMLKLNFVHYDDSAYIYPYVHTKRDIFPMLEEIDLIAKRAATGEETEIVVTSPEYWPLPWYLAKYPRVTYPQRISVFTAPIIIASSKQAEEFLTTNGARYELTKSTMMNGGTYILRPGVELMVFVRRDLAAR